MAKLSWQPWHKVVTLRNDLRSGELPLHLFAADIYEVLGGEPVFGLLGIEVIPPPISRRPSHFKRAIRL